MKWFLFLLAALLVVVAFMPAVHGATPCDGDQCKVAPLAVVAGTAGRSAACVGKVAVAPLKAIAKIKPVRSAAKKLATRQPIRRVAKGVRLLCPLGKRRAE